jgi:predicted nuclease of predicted toxin-antitoxin system
MSYLLLILISLVRLTEQNRRTRTYEVSLWPKRWLPLDPHLQALGHDVRTISRDYPGGIPDEEVLAIAQTEGRILVTADTDFGELLVHQYRPHAGVILVRLPGASLERLAVVLHDDAQELSSEQLVVVSFQVIRTRRTQQH